jgi:peptidoglycan/LPS O-acetylase OafA/YrhL
VVRIEKLEAMRGLAAIYIVFHHIIAFNHLEQRNFVLKLIFMHPQEAVLVFFMLSGFVVFLSAERSGNLTFRNYFKKRFVRIYPTTITAFVMSIILFSFNRYHFTINDLKILVGNLFMLQDDSVQPGLIVPVFLKNYPLWSLSYEWWFYMLFFPVYVLMKRYRLNIKINFIFLVLGISLIGWLCFLMVPCHVFLVITYFLLWWTGVACAEVYLKHKNFTLETLTPIFISNVILAAFISLPIGKGYYFDHQSWAQVNAQYPITTYLHYYLDVILFLVIGLCWWKYNLKGFDFLLGKFKILAPISFSLYIIHVPYLWLNISYISNLYILYSIKLAMIMLTACLLDLKLQSLANRLFHNKIPKNKIELENQAF